MENSLVRIPAVRELLQNEHTPCSTSEIIKCVSENPANLIIVVSKLDDVAIFRAGGGTQLSKLRRELGENATMTIVGSMIIDLADFYNLKNHISNQQIVVLTSLLLAEFWYMKIEQIARAFHLQKTQNLVKIYDRLDPSVLMEILHKYSANFSWVNENDAVRYKEGYDPNRTGGQEREAMRQANVKYLQTKKP